MLCAVASEAGWARRRGAFWDGSERCAYTGMCNKTDSSTVSEVYRLLLYCAVQGRRFLISCCGRSCLTASHVTVIPMGDAVIYATFLPKGMAQGPRRCTTPGKAFHVRTGYGRDHLSCSISSEAGLCPLRTAHVPLPDLDSVPFFFISRPQRPFFCHFFSRLLCSSSAAPTRGKFRRVFIVLPLVTRYTHYLCPRSNTPMYHEPPAKPAA